MLECPTHPASPCALIFFGFSIALHVHVPVYVRNLNLSIMNRLAADLDISDPHLSDQGLLDNTNFDPEIFIYFGLGHFGAVHFVSKCFALKYDMITILF